MLCFSFISCKKMIISDIKGQIWLDGTFCDWRDASIHVLSHTLHYGTGVFEGVRAYESENGTAIFRLDDHTERLFQSAKLIGMKIPYSVQQLMDAQCESVKTNQLKNAYIRPICFYGNEGMGLRADNLKVHVAIASWDWGPYLGEEKITNGIKVKVSKFPKRDPEAMLYKAKATGNYLNSMLALTDALESGFDEALILGSNNTVNEGSGENFFLIKDGKLITPDLVTVLDGITRKTIIDLAKDINIETIERKIDINEVFDCDEAFFTGTAAEVTPIVQVDDRKIGNAQPGDITKRLQKNYFDLIHGKINKYNDWLTTV